MRKEYEIRQEVDRQIRREVSSKLTNSIAHEIAHAIQVVEKQIELAKDKDPEFHKRVGYLAGLKFAAALVELQALQNEKALEKPLLQIGSDSETKCEAV
jgi:predicted solute-binding protein